MSLRISPREGVAPGLRRVVREQIGKSIDEIESDALGVHETVHKIRLRCKKCRALVRLVRDAFDDYTEVNRAFRDAARRVSDLRDARAALETLASTKEERASALLEDDAFAPLEAELARALDRSVESHAGALDEVRADLVAIERDVDDWTLDEDGFDALAGGLHRTFRRARERLEDAYDDPSTEAFHEWRKRVKYHRYHVRLLQDLWPAPLRALRGELHKLTDVLGDMHDRAELKSVLDDLEVDDELARGLAAFLDQERIEFRERARPLGERAFAETPADFVTRVGAMWSAARALGV